MLQWSFLHGLWDGLPLIINFIFPFCVFSPYGTIDSGNSGTFYSLQTVAGIENWNFRKENKPPQRYQEYGLSFVRIFRLQISQI